MNNSLPNELSEKVVGNSESQKSVLYRILNLYTDIPVKVQKLVGDYDDFCSNSLDKSPFIDVTKSSLLSS